MAPSEIGKWNWEAFVYASKTFRIIYLLILASFFDFNHLLQECWVSSSPRTSLCEYGLCWTHGLDLMYSYESYPDAQDILMTKLSLAVSNHLRLQRVSRRRTKQKVMAWILYTGCFASVHLNALYFNGKGRCAQDYRTVGYPINGSGNEWHDCIHNKGLSTS